MKKYACLLIAFSILPKSCQNISSQDNAHFTFLSLAMANYTKVHHKMPGNITDKDGKALLSWRVALLEGSSSSVDAELFKQFHLDEPWNSPHNLKVAQTVPFMYIDPKGSDCTPLSEHPISPLWQMDPKPPNYTPYLGVTGAKAAFRPGKPREVKSGSTSRAAIVIVDKSDVLWTEPRDISLEKAKKGNSLRWYDGKATMYLTNHGSPMHWKKVTPYVDPRQWSSEYEPPEYEFESDE